jgi:hypothetical protein
MSDQKEKTKKTIKSVLIVVLLLILSLMGLVSVPVVIIWMIWKKTNLKKSLKWSATAATIFLYFIAWGMIGSSGEPPVITVTEPALNYISQSKEIAIKGKVVPKESTLRINTDRIEVDKNSGDFSYLAQLANESNKFQFVATANSKMTNYELNIKRELSQEEKDQKEAQSQQNQLVEKEKSKSDLNAQLTKSISEVKNYRPLSRDSVDLLLVEVAGFTLHKESIDKAKSFNDDQIKKLGVDLESELKNLQTKEFPAIRKAYGSITNKSLWEQDIEVKVSGAGNSTLMLTGALFAANKNIKDTQGILQETLELLRFKKVQYEWYSGASEFDYYNLETKKDNEI